MRKTFLIPIFDATVHLIINKDIAGERKKYEYSFGPSPAGDYEALCSYNGHEFALFFKPNVSIKRIGHEIFHLTHRILEWVEVKFDKDNHETAAYLHGYLMQEILPCLVKAKILDRLS